MARLMQGAARRLALMGQELSLSGTLLDGTPLAWRAYRGKVVLVDFWAIGSPPGIDDLLHAYEVYHDRGLEIVGVNLQDERQRIRAFLSEARAPWATLYSEEFGRPHPLAIQYGVVTMPTTLLVDRSGKVASLRARGPELDRLLAALLGPPSGAKGPFTPLDLQPKANWKLTESAPVSIPTEALKEVAPRSLSLIRSKNHLEELPQGDQRFAGIPFRIGPAAVLLGGDSDKLPRRVDGIALDGLVAKLYILHATQRGMDDAEVARYEVHCADGSVRSIPVVYGADVRAWWDFDRKPASRGKVVWTGHNEAAQDSRRLLRLYLTVWENPLPQSQVRGLSYLCLGTPARRSAWRSRPRGPARPRRSPPGPPSPDLPRLPTS